MATRGKSKPRLVSRKLWHVDEWDLGGVDDWQAVRGSSVLARVTLHPLPAATLANLSPADRLRAHRTAAAAHVERLARSFRLSLQSQGEVTIVCRLEASNVLGLARDAAVFSIELLEVPGRSRAPRARPLERWFAIRALFELRIEGSIGSPTKEERVVLLKSTSSAGAADLLAEHVRRHERPYLNEAGNLVGWHMAKILDIAEPGFARLRKTGTEVYSRLIDEEEER